MPIDESALYVYRARILRAIDGDTVEAEMDLGFSVRITKKLRLYGIDTPEMRGEEKQAGKEARDHLIKLMYMHALNQKGGQVKDCPVLLVKTHKDKEGKYGRMLAELMGLDGDEPIILNQKMVEDSFASQVET